MEKPKFYITTSIPYVNAPPHIGFALELIQADVLARYRRSLKEDVFFLTGTDEHGLKIAEAAKKANKDFLEFAAENSDKYKDLTKALNISNDGFIRTTDEKKHVPAVIKIWNELIAKGDLYKKKYIGLYCSGCEAFLTKRDLAGSKCSIHLKEPETVKEENYFFRLSKYLPEVKRLIDSNELKIVPETKKKEILKMIEQGIEDISFSRDKDKYWGIGVPDDSLQSIYVWPDALSNYISAIGYLENSSSFQKYWPADIHCIGKDIAKFHCIYWPAILLSLGLDLPRTVFIHGFITVSGQKMSKSLGNVVDPFELASRYGTDPVRYFLLRELPSTEDGDFTIEKLEQRYNSDLANGIGNLLARTLKLAEITGCSFEKTDIFSSEIEKTKEEQKKSLQNFKFNEALASVFGLVSFFDKKINEEKPWQTKNQDLIKGILWGLKEIADLLAPFLPETSEEIKRQLETKDSKPLFLRI